MSAPQVEHEVPPRKSPQERWAEIQRRGILSFVLWRGVVLIGLLYGIIRMLDVYIGASGADDWRFELLQFVLIVIVLGPIMALCDWRSMKRKLRGNANKACEGPP
jgi:hypothetical protein